MGRAFFARDTHRVAQELLGKLLVRRWRGKTITGRIIEVESYVGENDKACHAARGRTKRNEVMFGEAGHAYVYIIYGMYNCLNIVTERVNFPAAVLIRALKPGKNILTATDGPGKLTRALHVTRAQNHEDLTVSEKLFVADDGLVVGRGDIKRAPRIGVEYAGEDAARPWRYYVEMTNGQFPMTND